MGYSSWRGWISASLPVLIMLSAEGITACGNGQSAVPSDVARTCHAVDAVVATVAAHGNDEDRALINSEVSGAEKSGSVGSNADLRREALAAQSAEGKSSTGVLSAIESMAVTCKALGLVPQKSSSPSAVSPPSVPSGWVNHDFGKAAIAIPPSWQVKHDTACSTSTSGGVLLLGEPNPPTETCDESHPPSNTVALVADLDPHGYSGSAKPEMVNGITVFPDAPGRWIRWVIPSLGVVLAGTGSYANAVLHTLHRS